MLNESVNIDILIAFIGVLDLLPAIASFDRYHPPSGLGHCLDASRPNLF